MRRLLPLFGLLLCLPISAQAVDDEESSAAAMRQFYAADGEAATEAAIEALRPYLERYPHYFPRELKRGPEYSEPAEKGWSIRPVVYPDGVTRNYHLYVPENYDPKNGHPVLIHMHGGVSRPEPLSEADLAGYRDWWMEQAEALGFLVVFPLGQLGAEWWTENGAGGVHRIIRELKCDFAVDENRVFATGFSDGGSGAFYLAMTHPTFFAGFIPLNGHPAVASGASKRQLYLSNMTNRPLYVVNTQDDQLYPTVSILPFLTEMIRAGVQVQFTTYPGIGHTPAYRDEQNPLIARFIAETERVALPTELSFATADVAIGRHSWLTILELGETPDAPEFKDHNVMMPEGGVRIGVQIDQEFTGTGTRVSAVVPDSVAEACGLAPGDVIIGIDDADVAGMGDLRSALGAKRAGQTVRVRYRRNDQTIESEGAFPPYVPQPAFPRKKPSGRIELTAAGNHVDVRLNGVTKFALDISPEMFDLDSDLVVTVNGKEAFRGMVNMDLEFMLRGFARDRDKSMLFAARVVVGE